MKLVLLLLSLGAVAFAKHPSECLDVKLARVNSTHYEAKVLNRCEQPIKVACVLVKFFNSAWERTGVDAFTINYMAPREVIRHLFKASEPFEHVGVRAITDDPLDTFK